VRSGRSFGFGGNQNLLLAGPSSGAVASVHRHCSDALIEVIGAESVVREQALAIGALRNEFPRCVVEHKRGKGCLGTIRACEIVHIDTIALR
jgi:hypothetical protein